MNQYSGNKYEQTGAAHYQVRHHSFFSGIKFQSSEVETMAGNNDYYRECPEMGK